MKKFLTLIIAFIYLGMSSGIAMEVHYCMGKIAGVELFTGEDHQCGKCGMKKKSGCCKDELKVYKLADSHKAVHNNIEFNPGEALVPVTLYPLLHFDWTTADEKAAVTNHSPPDPTGPSLTIRYGVFRI